MSETVRIGKRTFRILFPDLLRPLGDRERQDLKNSIRKRGVIVPIVVDEFDNVIDGGNRVTLAAEVGLNGIGTEVYRDMTMEQKAALATSLNKNRRHLTPAERKSLAEERRQRESEAVALANQGMNQREIAAQTGMSQASVSRVLQQSTDASDSIESLASPASTQGSNGKTYLPPAALEERREKVADLAAEGMTQREIAKEVGIDQSQVARDLKAVAAKASGERSPTVLPDPSFDTHRVEPSDIEAAKTTIPSHIRDACAALDIESADGVPFVRDGQHRVLEDDGEHDAPEPTEWAAHLALYLSHAKECADRLGMTLREAVYRYENHSL